jgi:NAD(P)H-hydrate epimerase
MVVASSPGSDESSLDGGFPVEVVTRRLSHVDWSDAVLDDLSRFGSLVIGPGLGRLPATIDAAVRAVVEAEVPVVVDGDGLFALADADGGGLARLSSRRAATVLTPHDGEFARLTGSPPGSDRVSAARQLAQTSGAVVLLKGPVTIVAAPDGFVDVVVEGDQRLATAGTGDVLSGVIGALLAMQVPAPEAAAAGAWLHARAGAALAPLGLVAGDLIGVLPAVLNSLIDEAPA